MHGTLRTTSDSFVRALARIAGFQGTAYYEFDVEAHPQDCVESTSVDQPLKTQTARFDPPPSHLRVTGQRLADGMPGGRPLRTV